MYKTALRIQARATRRCGELLKQIDGRGEHRRSIAPGTSSTQQAAATDAGLSKRQQVTAVRLANVYEPDFEYEVERPDPPTITALAEQGTKKRDWTPPDGFEEATKLLGTVRRFSDFCEAHEPEAIDPDQPDLIEDQAA